MMKLDKKTLHLITVGASIGANCKACLETSIALALESGADEQEIEQAIAAGKKIRQCATKMDRLAGSPNLAALPVNREPAACCGSTEKTQEGEKVQ
jgi:AhpD family alkylhydroperoxidase